MSKHTPGPWQVKIGSQQPKLQVWRHEPNQLPITRIADVIEQPIPIEHGDHVCNASLIAAAPDLLEACQEAIIALDMDDKFGDDIDARHDAEENAFLLLKSAVRKATGGSNGTA